MKPFQASAAYATDLQLAYNYFKLGGPRAAERFWERYERAWASIRVQPESCRLRLSGWRQKAVPQSSYAIFYRETPAFWFLGGVLSTVQDPDLLQARLLIREVGAGDLGTSQRGDPR